MNSDATKVSPNHLDRDAYLYVRQSTLRQVMENTESTQRQYALRERAIALGWPIERVQVIDCDQGQSGASAAGREGFQRLVAEVSLGHAGIVLGLEVSRLARNNSDWHRLLEISGLTGTLILDEDGLYDPSQFNDRLFLGLKGTISEAELHVLKARLRGGILNKARRGELKNPLPVGLVYDAQGRVVLDPDRRVQDALRLLFATYERTGSCSATVKHFRRQGLLLPRRLRSGLRKGELVWGTVGSSRVLQVLHNPRYAGAFFHGRTRSFRSQNGRGRSQRRLPPDQWHALLPESHAGYINWDQYQRNQAVLRENAQAHGRDRRHGPPGGGPALLQGMVVCGLCGRRMTVCYCVRKVGLVPKYVCQREVIEHAERICQSISGLGIDEAVGGLLLEILTPWALEVALAVQQELQQRLDEADHLRRQHVERARYDADLAKDRFMQVDPKNRLVADALEADWNERLRALTAAQEQYERQRQADRAVLDEESRSRILALTTDFPKLWNDPKTPDRERKRMARLLIEDVTLTKGEQLTIQVRFRGGAVRTLISPLPQPSWMIWQTNREVVAEVDRLLEDHTDSRIAAMLNERGWHPGKGGLFTKGIIACIQNHYCLRSRFDRLREAGMLTQQEMANELGVTRYTIQMWRRIGLLKALPYNDKQYLYEPVGTNPPHKQQGVKRTDLHRFPTASTEKTKEVQDEA
jgi:DNA invertase Pin-like site-specific DNA recombinase